MEIKWDKNEILSDYDDIIVILMGIIAIMIMGIIILI